MITASIYINLLSFNWYFSLSCEYGVFAFANEILSGKFRTSNLSCNTMLLAN